MKFCETKNIKSIGSRFKRIFSKNSSSSLVYAWRKISNATSKMDDLMEQINDQLDVISERLITLDGSPYSTLEEFL